MVSFKRGKHAVITPIDRTGYEVIENFGLRSWQIRMQGILVDSDSHNYPQRLVKKITEMFELQGLMPLKEQSGMIWIFKRYFLKMIIKLALLRVMLIR
nr:DUF6046 domain-containing protein [Saccharicrinis fermentans]